MARYRRFLARQQQEASYRYCDRTFNFNFSTFFGLPRCDIFVFGRGGLKCDFVGVQEICDCVRRLRPTLVVLELGTNDIADASVLPDQAIARIVADGISYLHWRLKQLGVECLTWCQVVMRRSVRGPLAAFEPRRLKLNRLIQNLARRDYSIQCFLHDRRAIVTLHESISDDDIHITEYDGFRLYHLSIRRAITQTVKQWENKIARF